MSFHTEECAQDRGTEIMALEKHNRRRVLSLPHQLFCFLFNSRCCCHFTSGFNNVFVNVPLKIFAGDKNISADFTNVMDRYIGLEFGQGYRALRLRFAGPNLVWYILPSSANPMESIKANLRAAMARSSARGFGACARDCQRWTLALIFDDVGKSKI